MDSAAAAAAAPPPPPAAAPALNMSSPVFSPSSSTVMPNYLSPKEALLAMLNAGIRKTQMSLERTFLLAFMGGVFVGLGGTSAVFISLSIPNPELAWLRRILLAAAFPVGLVIIILTGAELFTGNTAVLLFPWLQRKITFKQLILNWVVVYIGNFLGCVAVAFFLVDWPDTNHITNRNEPVYINLVAMTHAKVMKMGWGSLVLKGIACNLCVTLAIYCSFCSMDVISKMTSAWYCIFTFVIAGWEHSIANMYFCTLALMIPNSDLDLGYNFWDFLGRNLIPVTIGNIIGGSFLMATMFWYCYISPKQWHTDPKSEDHHDDLSHWGFVRHNIWPGFSHQQHHHLHNHEDYHPSVQHYPDSSRNPRHAHDAITSHHWYFSLVPRHSHPREKPVTPLQQLA